MSGLPPPSRVPTLTEIVSLADEAADLELPSLQDVQAEPAPPPPAGGSATAASSFDRAAIVDEALREVLLRADAVLEARLRAALAPMLAGLLDHLVEDARTALVASVREMVQQAVAEAIERRVRQPSGEQPR